MNEVAASPSAQGLRERQKLRRRARIAEEALRLFDLQGFQETTIAQIAEAAEVSPRTVSSYFPAKEDLAFPDQQEWMDRFGRVLRDREPEKSALMALQDWVDVVFADASKNREQHELRRRIVDSDLGLKAYERRFVDQATAHLRTEIARDLGCSPEDLAPRIASAATMAVFETLGELFKGESAAADAERNPEAWRAEVSEMVDQAVRFIAGGLRSLGD